MKITIITFLILFCLSLNIYSQNEMMPKEVFFYTMKANDFKLGDMIPINFSNSINWVTFFGKVFDKANFVKSTQDEFIRNSYFKNLNDEVNKGLDRADLNKTFTIKFQMTLGEFDFQNSFFPIQKNNLSLLTLYRVDDYGFEIRVGSVINLNDFKYILKMNTEDARNFINSSKDGYGKVDRDIYSKVTYNVVHKKFDYTSSGSFLAIYIHKIEFFFEN